MYNAVLRLRRCFPREKINSGNIIFRISGNTVLNRSIFENVTIEKTCSNVLYVLYRSCTTFFFCFCCCCAALFPQDYQTEETANLPHTNRKMSFIYKKHFILPYRKRIFQHFVIPLRRPPWTRYDQLFLLPCLIRCWSLSNADHFLVRTSIRFLCFVKCQTSLHPPEGPKFPLWGGTAHVKNHRFTLSSYSHGFFFFLIIFILNFRGVILCRVFNVILKNISFRFPTSSPYSTQPRFLVLLTPPFPIVYISPDQGINRIKSLMDYFTSVICTKSWTFIFPVITKFNINSCFLPYIINYVPIVQRLNSQIQSIR